MILISIIVPVYNTEKYLEKCIESIINQSYKYLEILLINDGSTDNSGEICDHYALKDSRIEVYHQPNRGISAVRQFGIEKASGDYSIHVDSDDWIEKNMLEEMYSVIKKENCEILITDFFYDNQNESIISKQQPAKLAPNSIINDILSAKLHGSTCNKLIRHDLYKKFLISFPQGLNYCEDQLVIIQLLLNVKKVSYQNKSFYHYVHRQDSITNNIDKNFFYLKVFPYIAELEKILGNKFPLSITTNKLVIKLLLFDSDLFTLKEVKSFYPVTNSQILESYLGMTIKIKLLLINNRLGAGIAFIQKLKKVLLFILKTIKRDELNS